MMKIKKALVIMLAFVTVMSFTACGGGSSDTEDAGELNIYMWSEYMSEDFVDKFEEETGITVNFSCIYCKEADKSLDVIKAL